MQQKAPCLPRPLAQRGLLPAGVFWSLAVAVTLLGVGMGCALQRVSDGDGDGDGGGRMRGDALRRGGVGAGTDEDASGAVGATAVRNKENKDKDA